MGTYVYGITSEEDHPEYGAIGVMEFLYKPWARNCASEKLNKRLDDRFAKPIRNAYKGRKVPKFVRFSSGDIYQYKGRSPIWIDSKENLIGDKVWVAEQSET